MPNSSETAPAVTTPPAASPAPSPEPTPPPAATPAPVTAVEPETLLGKEGSNGKAAPAAPDKYTVTLPDGMALDDKMLGALSPALKAADLSNEVVQQLAADLAKYQEDSYKESEKAAAEERKQWVAELRKDPNFDALVTNAKRAVAMAGKDAGAVREWMNATGAGDNPAMVRWLAAIGDRLSETPFVTGQGAAIAAKDKSLGALLYGATTPA